MATKTDLLRKIRMFCSECMGGPRVSENVWPISNISDVAECPADKCAWHRYRFGKDPEKNPARVAHGKKLAAHLRSGVE